MRCGLLLGVALLLHGCAAVNAVGDGISGFGTGLGNMGEKALEVIGFKKPDVPPAPELPESAKPARKMKLRLAASDSLNTDPAGRSLSLVVRVYKLRSPAAFLAAPYETFGNSAKEKEVLGDELLEVRELMLMPGQQQQISERWSREATHVGVVGLFRSPGPQRWRYAFELEALQMDEGLVMGAHSCTMSVASGEPVGIDQAALRLVPLDCRIAVAGQSSDNTTSGR